MTEYRLSPLTPLATGVESRGKLQLPIKCLLCDIYGTLFISGSGDIGISRGSVKPHKNMELLLARHRIELPAADLLNKFHEAVEARHAAARNEGIDVPEVKIDEIWAQILDLGTVESARPFAMEFEMTINPVWPMPGLRQLLAACRSNGLLLGIISNAQFYTLPLFQQFLDAGPMALGFHQDLIFLSYRHGCAKPSARLFQKASAKLNQMNLSPEHVAFIGNDMRNDIVPARKTGFQTILFAGDARSLRTRPEDPICAGIQPDLVVTQFDQLISALQGDEMKVSAGRPDD